MLATVQNETIATMIKDCYSQQDIRSLFSLLKSKGTFRFSSLDNGLFPAASLNQENSYTGYSFVWVRDNIHVAFAHAFNGETECALRTTATLMQYFLRHKWHFERIVSGELDPNDPMNRPHVRFLGENLSEVDQKWAHAQNDALGYFLWLYCKLRGTAPLLPSAEEVEMLALFVLYLDRIQYWKDEDSGHWEEIRKIAASSIGIATAGLKEVRNLVTRLGWKEFAVGARRVTLELLDQLIQQGQESLANILPAECVQQELGKNRRYDSALLFLIFPTDVVSEEMADTILSDVLHNLQGEYGIRRYLGDSFWTADYKKKVKPEERTIDVSDQMSSRDSLSQPGEEAQWCIFDPIVSAIYGLRYQKRRDASDLHAQIKYFNRSLSQLTGDDCPFGAFKCPELYYQEDNKYVPNDVVPLLWTQANLWMAFKVMEDSTALL